MAKSPASSEQNLVCRIWGFHSSDYEEYRLLGSGTVDLIWADISEEHMTSVFGVEKSVSEEPAWAGG
jgi:hypothetical protein